MIIVINLGRPAFFKRSTRVVSSSRALGTMVRPFLEALVLANQYYLRHYDVPPLYRSGVRYEREPEDKPEEFAAIPVVLSRGWGDCDDLATWRVAELRNSGERAKIRLKWKKRPGKGRLYHVLVRREDGTVEDPSDKLGMRERE